MKSMDSTQVRSLHLRALVACLAIHAICILTLLTNYLVDDAFIYLQIASNGARGLGHFFDPLSRVNVASSALYPFMLSGLLAIGVPDIVSLKILHLLGVWLLSIGLFQAAKPLGSRLGFVIAILPCLEPRLILSVGMETSLFLGVSLWSLYVLELGRIRLSAFLAVLAISLRPDAFVIPFIACGWLGYRHRRLSLQYGLYVGLFLLLLVWAFISYFGVALPQSIAAKVAFASLEVTEGQRWIVAWATQLPLLWVTLPIAIIGIISLMRQRVVALNLFLLFCVLQVGAYAYSNAPSPFYWYFVPGNIGILIVTIIGVQRIACKVSPRVVQQFSDISMVPVVPGVALVAVVGLMLSLLPPYRSSLSYTSMSDWVRENTQPTASIAADEIGYIGYLSQRRIVDMNALLHPEALPAILQRHWGWWLGKDPDFVMTHVPPRGNEPSPTRWSAEDYSLFLLSYEVFYEQGSLTLWRRRTSVL